MARFTRKVTAQTRQHLGKLRSSFNRRCVIFEVNHRDFSLNRGIVCSINIFNESLRFPVLAKSLKWHHVSVFSSYVYPVAIHTV